MTELGLVVHTFNPSSQKTERQVNIFIKASQSYTEKPYLKRRPAGKGRIAEEMAQRLRLLTSLPGVLSSATTGRLTTICNGI